MNRLSPLLGAVLVLQAVATTPVRAQDQPVVFQHGFRSNGSDWGQTPTTLHQLFRLRDIRPTTNACKSYTFQTKEDSAQLPASLGNTLAWVGHSNGGLLGRNFNLLFGRTNRIASIGSPMLGAPLAENWLNGNVLRFGRYIAQTIASVRSYYYWYDDALLTPFGYSDIYAPNMYWLGSNMMPLFAAQGWAYDAVTHFFCPVILDMQPSSRILNDTLNSAANLAREATTLQARVSITADKSPINGIFHLLFPDDPAVRQRWIDTRWGFYAGSIASYFSYSRSASPTLRYRANDFLSLAGLMIDLDFWLAKLNGSLIPGSYRVSGQYPFDPRYELVAPGDLAVPLGRQHFPNFTRDYPVQGVSHTQEKRSLDVLNRLITVMGTDFNIPSRSPGSVASVDVQPATLTLSSTVSYPLSVKTFDVYGQLLVGKPVTWSTSSPSIATVSSAGVVTAQSGVGSTLVVASSGGYADTTSLNVVPNAPFTSVSISGPGSRPAGLDGTWLAVANGGSLPINYVWKVNNVLRGTGPAFTWGGTSSYVITLVATDAAAVTRTATKNVLVTGCSGGCNAPHPRD